METTYSKENIKMNFSHRYTRMSSGLFGKRGTGEVVYYILLTSPDFKAINDINQNTVGAKAPTILYNSRSLKLVKREWNNGK